MDDDSKYIKSKSKKRDKNKNVGNTINRTRQTHCQAILIRLTTVTIDSRDAQKGEPSVKGPKINIPKFNSEAADNRV